MMYYRNMPCQNKRGRQADAGTSHATSDYREDSEGDSSNSQVNVNTEDQIFNRIAQRLATNVEMTQGDPRRSMGSRVPLILWMPRCG